MQPSARRSPHTPAFTSASVEGHDWCIVQLGVPGRIWGVDVDTSFFTGNHSPRVSIQGACLGTRAPQLASRVASITTNVALSPADASPDAILEGERTGKAASAGELAAVAKVTQPVSTATLLDRHAVIIFTS